MLYCNGEDRYFKEDVKMKLVKCCSKLLFWVSKIRFKMWKIKCVGAVINKLLKPSGAHSWSSVEHIEDYELWSTPMLGSWDSCDTQFPKEVVHDSWKSGSPAGSGPGAIAMKTYRLSGFLSFPMGRYWNRHIPTVYIILLMIQYFFMEKYCIP